MAAIYLTFDDGPLAGTDDVIAVLNSKRAKGTLFMVGDHVSSEWRRRVLNAAHSSRYVQVANHSSTHANHRYGDYYRDPAAVVDGFQRATRTLRITQQPVRARLPGRNTWRVGNVIRNDPTNGGDSGGAADRLAAAGYRIYGWDAEWPMRNSRPTLTPDQMIARVKQGLEGRRTQKPNHMVVLMHDVMFRASNGDRAKLERFIDLLSADGHGFAFISGFDGAAAG